MRVRFKKWLQKPELVFIVLSLFFGTISAFTVPQLSVNDENMHFLRGYSLASLNIGNKACKYPEEVSQRAFSIYKQDFGAYYAKRVDLSHLKSSSCGSAASYSPIMHLPQATGIAIAKAVYPSTGMMVLLGRLTNLIFYSITVFLIISYARIGKLVILVICLFPIMVHSAASLSADTVSNVVALAFVIYVINLFLQKTNLNRSQIVQLVLFTSALALSKSSNLILLLPLLFLPNYKFGSTKIQSILRKILIIICCGIVGLASLFVWQKIYGSAIMAPAINSSLTHSPVHFLHILYGTYVDPFMGYNDIVLRGIIGEFSSFKYHLPLFMIIANFSLLLMVFLYTTDGEKKIVKRIRMPLVFATLTTIVISVIAITYTLYVTWAIQPYRLGIGARYADGVQGRYFTVLIALLLPLFVQLRKYVRLEARSDIFMHGFVYVSCVLILAFYTLETLRFFY